MENPDILSGEVFLGQFIDHDMTFDRTPMPEQEVDPKGLVNFDSPFFDLASVYGRGPDLDPQFYEADGMHMRIVRTAEGRERPDGVARATQPDPRQAARPAGRARRRKDDEDEAAVQQRAGSTRPRQPRLGGQGTAVVLHPARGRRSATEVAGSARWAPSSSPKSSSASSAVTSPPTSTTRPRSTGATNRPKRPIHHGGVRSLRSGRLDRGARGAAG